MTRLTSVQYLSCFILALCTLTINPSSDSSFGTGPELYLPFDHTIKDESGNDHKVFSRGCKMAKDRFGKEDQSIYLDGSNDHLVIPDDGSLTFKKFSIAFWFRTSSDRLQNLIGKEDFDTAEGAVYQLFINWQKYPGIGFNIVNNDMPCYFANGLTSSYTNSRTTVEVGKWHFVVATWNGKTQNLYIDGKLIDTEKPGFKGIRDCSTEIRIGIWYQNSLPFEGQIDEVMIFKRVLSQKQIERLAKN